MNSVRWKEEILQLGVSPPIPKRSIQRPPSASPPPESQCWDVGASTPLPSGKNIAPQHWIGGEGVQARTGSMLVLVHEWLRVRALRWCNIYSTHRLGNRICNHLAQRTARTMPPTRAWSSICDSQGYIGVLTGSTNSIRLGNKICKQLA